jgi:hypothetical protein
MHSGVPSRRTSVAGDAVAAAEAAHIDDNIVSELTALLMQERQTCGMLRSDLDAANAQVCVYVCACGCMREEWRGTCLIVGVMCTVLDAHCLDCGLLDAAAPQVAQLVSELEASAAECRVLSEEVRLSENKNCTVRS